MKHIKLFEDFISGSKLEIIPTKSKKLEDLDIIPYKIFMLIHKDDVDLRNVEFFPWCSNIKDIDRLEKTAEYIVSLFDNNEYTIDDFFIADFQMDKYNHHYTLCVRNNDISRKYLDIKKHIEDITINKTKNTDMLSGIAVPPYNVMLASVFPTPENIEYLKTNNIRYNIIPTNKMDIEYILRDIFTQKLKPKYGTPFISDTGYIKKTYECRFVNLPHNFDNEYFNTMKNDISKLINKINNELNINLTFSIKPILSDDSISDNIMNKLNGTYEGDTEPKYKNVEIFIKNLSQGKVNDDSDFMALVWLDTNYDEMPIIMKQK